MSESNVRSDDRGSGPKIIDARTDLPRIIWILWYQSLDRAPSVVRACVESWQAFNPAWRVNILDEHTIRNWIDIDDVIDVGRPDLTTQKISATVRLCLLRQYGGVWSDATVFCLRSLDDWLPGYLTSGFFAFRNPGPDRLMSNWFIAAEKDTAYCVVPG